MHYYKHYSFDLWLTLIRSDPRFKKERTRIFHQRFNTLHKSEEEVARVFRQADLMCNAVNERTGKNIDADEMYLMVISMINDNQLDLHGIDTGKLCAEMDDLLQCYLPVLYHDDTLRTLDHLKQKSGATLGLLSNTGFITGTTLQRILPTIGLGGYFDLALYSDVVGLSKPAPELFNLLLTSVQEVNKGKAIHLTDIIHVGDNPITDIAGAKAAGMHSMLVNSNNVSIQNLLN